MDYIDYKKVGNIKELHFWYKARLNLISNLFNKILGGSGKKFKILDIGCGIGTEIKILKNYGEITVIDKNKKALEIAGNEGVKRIWADVEEIAIPKKSYDVICAFDVLEHLNNDKKSLEKIYASLKKNGYLFFTVPAFPSLFSTHDLAMGHKKRYLKKEVISLLKTTGFNIVKINYWNTILFPLIAVVRIIKKLKKGSAIESDAHKIPKIINVVLYHILNLENKNIFFNLTSPFGLSIYGVAKKESIYYNSNTKNNF